MCAQSNLGRYPVTGAGLGLRRGLLRELDDLSPDEAAFLEVAPENWMRLGGRFERLFADFAERFPLVCHGLSLSIGAPAPLDSQFLTELKAFLDRYQIRCYSEHLSYCGDQGHLYDLLPIPFTAEAVRYVAERVRAVQERLERRIVLEHVSAYIAQSQELTEIEFVNAVLDEADCDLLIDVNNVYVNSINFGFDAADYIRALPGERIAYGHIAGHYVESSDLRVDTHGSAVIEPVWELLDVAFEAHGVFPVLLERDFNFPKRAELLAEVARIRSAQGRAAVTTRSYAPRDPVVYLGHTDRASAQQMTSTTSGA
ncbi:MAG: DUF692 domain-containing protein [Pseudomonadota bacterium]